MSTKNKLNWLAVVTLILLMICISFLVGVSYARQDIDAVYEDGSFRGCYSGQLCD